MLTYAGFQATYPTSPLTQSQVDRWLNLYKRQLKGYFRFDDTPRAELFDIEFCGQSKVFLKQPLVLDVNFPIIVEELNKRTRMLTAVSSQTDFLFRSEIAELGQEYIYALDFGCQGCICKCDMLKITGVWGLELPDYLEDYIYELINEQAVQAETSGDACQEIASEQIGEYRVTYRDKSSDKCDTCEVKKDINNVFSIQAITDYILPIQSHFIYV